MPDCRLAGFEALVRLPTADGNLIPPQAFIPLAEDLRLIDRIGEWVLREACRTVATWPDHLTIAVNLSPAQFVSGDISSVVRAALDESGLAAGRLELEITENLMLGETETVLAHLRSLKAMGVSIVMDDFGTGYSSLAYLWRFPFDKIKIDRSFMLGLGNLASDAEKVVRTIITLGRRLNMKVTVEGVENESQLALACRAEADQAQGYYFGRPVPAAQIAAGILADFRQGCAWSARRAQRPLQSVS
jgi:EAL domain-containing protein (putative c-di-GMP-specific phosphodiesterase class I)